MSFVTSGKSGLKDQVALHYYYTSPSHWCTTHGPLLPLYARTISRHADGISRYSVPPSAGPLLPLFLTILGSSVKEGGTQLCVNSVMCTQVAVGSRRSCFECLGNIFVLLPWRHIVYFYCQHEPSDIVAQLHRCLLTLLVHLGSEPAIVQVSMPSLYT